jgi:hypothetical protein
LTGFKEEATKLGMTKSPIVLAAPGVVALPHSATLELYS